MLSIDILSKFGKVYVIGGYVRNLINKSIPSRDIDMCVIESLEEIANILKEYNIKHKISSIHSRNSNPNLKIDNKINILYFCHEGITYDVRQIESIEKYAKELDITYNSIFYDPIENKYYDNFNGIEDFKNGIIKHISTNCNYPRWIFRILRFITEYDHKLDSQTEKILYENIPILKGMHIDYVHEIFHNLHQKKLLDKYLQVLNNYGVFEYILPGFTINVDKLIEFENVECSLAYLLKYNKHDKMKEMHNYVGSYKINRQVIFLVSLFYDYGNIDTKTLTNRRKDCKLKTDILNEFVDKLGLDPSMKQICFYYIK